MSIPKRIFYVWGANETKRIDVEICIKTWHYTMPNYEIIEINENSTEYFNFQEELKNNKWFRIVYERKLYAYISDYVRIKTLYDNGGIYLDTDVTTIKSFDKFLNEPAFVGMQGSSSDGYQDLVEPAILGAQKNNKFIGKVLSFYNNHNNNNVWNTNIYSMPEIFKFILEDNYEKQVYPEKTKQKIIKYNDISIFPEEYFIPFRYIEKFVPKKITENTHSIHWFNASWIEPDVLFFLENKHKIPLANMDVACSKYLKSTSKNNLFEQIFSVKNTNDKTQKVTTFFGIKFRFRRDEN